MWEKGVFQGGVAKGNGNAEMNTFLGGLGRNNSRTT